MTDDITGERPKLALGQRLSEHFTLADLTYSETALRHGIDQSNPPPHILANLQEMAYFLEDVMRVTDHPLLINSCYRSERTNLLVAGSARTSAHTLGLAADIRCPEFGSPLELCLAIANTTLKWDQVIHEYSAWCHVGLGKRNRRMLLTKRKGQNFMAGLF